MASVALCVLGTFLAGDERQSVTVRSRRRRVFGVQFGSGVPAPWPRGPFLAGHQTYEPRPAKAGPEMSSAGWERVILPRVTTRMGVNPE